MGDAENWVIVRDVLPDLVESFGRYSQFAGQALLAAATSFRRPSALVTQFYAIYVGALPLAVVVGLSLGIVVWMHLHGVLVRLGPGYVSLLPQYLALAVVLEFAPLGAGFIVAGRTGASLSAELGSMRLTEQIDALESMGQSAMRMLVGPRVMACMLALPLLTVTIGFLAIAGGFLAEVLGGNMAWTEYMNACLRDLRMHDVLTAIAKTLVFGYLIGVTGCYVGMSATGGTEGVGRSATRGVVWSTFLVVVSNVLLVRLIQVVS